MSVILLLTSYFIIINLISFGLMGLDKWRAVKHAWRIPVATLFILAIIGGSIGSLCGMYSFRHKTRHASFVYGMPAILILQIIAVALLFRSPIQFGIM